MQVGHHWWSSLYCMLNYNGDNERDYVIVSSDGRRPHGDAGIREVFIRFRKN